MGSHPQAQSYVVLLTPEFSSPLKPHSRHKRFPAPTKLGGHWSSQKLERVKPVFQSDRASFSHPYAKADAQRHGRFLPFEEKGLTQRYWLAAFPPDPPGLH